MCAGRVRVQQPGRSEDWACAESTTTSVGVRARVCGNSQAVKEAQNQVTSLTKCVEAEIA